MSHHPERTARNVRPVNQPPSFTYHGFQYAEISGYPGELTADDLEVRQAKLGMDY